MIAVNQAMHLHSLIAQHRLLADATHGTHTDPLGSSISGIPKNGGFASCTQFFFGGPFGGEDFLPENNPY